VNQPPQAAAPRTDGYLVGFAGTSAALALVQIGVLGSGVFGMTMTPWLAWIVLLAAVGAAVALARQFRRVPLIPDEPIDAASPHRPGRLMTGFLILIFAAAALTYLQMWVVAVLRPVYDWDGLGYHIPAIHRWVQAGRVCWVDIEHPYCNGFPMAVEASAFLVRAALSTDRLIDAGTLWYLPHGFLGLAAMARALGARGVWPPLAGALFLMVPLVVGQSASCYVDAAFACTVIGTVAAASLLFARRGISSWRLWLLWGLNLGLMLGSKGTGILFAGLCGAVVLMGVLWTCAGWRRRAIVGLLAAVGIAVAVGGYWHIRNLVMTGSPVYPIQVQLGGWVIFKGYWGLEITGMGTPPVLRSVPEPVRSLLSWLQIRGRSRGADFPIGGWGYVWIAGGVPALVWAWVRLRRRRASAAFRMLLVMSVLVGLMYLAQPTRWTARFTLWLHALGLPCLALAMQHWVRPGRLNRVLLALAIVAACSSVYESRRALRHEWDMQTTTWFRQGTAVFPAPLDHVFPHLRRTVMDVVMREDVVARSRWAAYNTRIEGILCQPLGRRRIHILPDTPSVEDIQTIRKQGVRWVLWDDRVPLPETLLAQADCRELLLILRGKTPEEDRHFYAIRLRPPAR